MRKTEHPSAIDLQNGENGRYFRSGRRNRRLEKSDYGHQDALNFAAQLAAKTPNEIRVMHLTSNALIAHLNQHEPPSS